MNAISLYKKILKYFLYHPNYQEYTVLFEITSRINEPDIELCSISVSLVNLGIPVGFLDTLWQSFGIVHKTSEDRLDGNSDGRGHPLIIH